MKKNIRSFISMICVIGFCLYMMPANASAQWVHSADGYSYRDDGTGEKLTGWQAIQGDLYYFNDDGIALTGWQVINGNTYYFSSSKKGKMMTGKVKINGKTYDFGSDGILTGSSGTSKSTAKKATTKAKKKNPDKFPSGLKYGMSLSSVKKLLKGYDYKTTYDNGFTLFIYTSGTNIYIIFVSDREGFFMNTIMRYCTDELDCQIKALDLMALVQSSDFDYSPCCTIYDSKGYGYYDDGNVYYIMMGNSYGNYFTSSTIISRNIANIETYGQAEEWGEKVYDIIYDK